MDGKYIYDIAAFLKIVIPSPFFWIGLLSILFIFISWSVILSRIDLSVAVPVASFSYIGIPLVSMIFLHEKISWLRWSGDLSRAALGGVWWGVRRDPGGLLR